MNRLFKTFYHEGHDGAGEHHHHHEHEHEHTSKEERIALLKYMIDHNAHHAEELHDLAHGAGKEASELIHAAVKDIEESNEKLRKALEILVTE